MTTQTKWTPANIRCLRRCGLLASQKEMADRLRLEVNAVSMWERGRRFPAPKAIRGLEQVAESIGWLPGESCRGLCGEVMPPTNRRCPGHSLCDGKVIYCA